MVIITCFLDSLAKQDISDYIARHPGFNRIYAYWPTHLQCVGWSWRRRSGLLKFGASNVVTVYLVWVILQSFRFLLSLFPNLRFIYVIVLYWPVFYIGYVGRIYFLFSHMACTGFWCISSFFLFWWFVLPIIITNLDNA